MAYSAVSVISCPCEMHPEQLSDLAAGPGRGLLLRAALGEAGPPGLAPAVPAALAQEVLCWLGRPHGEGTTLVYSGNQVAEPSLERLGYRARAEPSWQLLDLAAAPRWSVERPELPLLVQLPAVAFSAHTLVLVAALGTHPTERMVGCLEALLGLLPDAGRYDLLLFSFGGWRWRYQRPQHLAVRWVRHGHRVFFIAPDFRPSLNPANARWPRPYSAAAIQENLVEVHLAGPEELHPLSKRPLESEVNALVASCLALAADWHIDRAISLVEFPFWGPLALRLRERLGWKVIYDCRDRFRGVLPHAHSMLSEEPRLVREADIVVATARLILEDLAGENDNLCLVPNAADVEHFAQPPAANPLAGLPRPVIGYVGAIAPWFDVEWVRHAAARHPEWSVVLVGSGSASVEALRGLSNVHLTGEVPYRELPGYLHAFDVCLIPFRPLPVIAATDPVKFYEYLAAGKPVVASDLPELRPYGDLVYLAKDAAAFTAAIARALAEDGAEKQAERQRFARENSWEARYQTLDREIVKILTGERPAAGRARDSAPGPAINRIRPAAVRMAAGGPAAWDGTLTVEGRGFRAACVVLVDEQPIPTDVVGPAELRGHAPPQILAEPGCRMVTVVDQETWRQSDPRVFQVERV